jgi:hypothetical protein
MSEDLVNQLTLNFLISKNQLQKLNKKIKDDASVLLKADKEVYGSRIKYLFNQLINDQSPDDLMIDVRNSFDLFINKCIYYLKECDHNELIEKERGEISEDINFEQEERDIELGNYVENENNQEDEEDDEDEQEDEDEQDEQDEQDEEQDEQDEEQDEEKELSKQPTLHIKEKYTNKTKSQGVEDIQKLPLNWFNNVRQNYKKNQIIPRRTEIKFTDGSINNGKKKI